MADIFVSYASEDRERVGLLVNALQTEGFSVWWDRRIGMGSSFDREIERELNTAACVVVVWSKTSVDSDWVREEAGEGLERNILVPVRIDDCRPPLGFRRVQTAALVDWPTGSSGLTEFLDSVRSTLGNAWTSSEREVPGQLALPRPSAPESRSTPTLKRLGVVAAATFVVAILVVAAIAWQHRMQRADEMIALSEQVEQLLAGNRVVKAYGLIRAAQFGADAANQWLANVTTISSFDASVPGATVSIKAYDEPESDWVVVGQTPMKDVAIPTGELRVKVEAAGFTKAEFAAFNPGPYFGNQDIDPDFEIPLVIPMSVAGEIPQGMVHIPETTLDLPMFGRPMETTKIEEFFIDRSEVTNRAYKAFVEAGGYQDKGYWQGLDFKLDGRLISWADAMASFIDSTGRPGPATWELGTYATGQDNKPVLGVSWYEAVAYSRFADRSLPTAYQWSRAAFGMAYSSPIWHASVDGAQFGAETAREVGDVASLGPFGTVDMPGNAREWVWNAMGDRHLALGGGYSEPRKIFSQPQRRSPMDRTKENGFRLVINPQPLSADALARLPWTLRDIKSAKPVSDEKFDAMTWQYTFSSTPLNPSIVEATEYDTYIREVVEIETGYGDRMRVHLLRPKEGGPFQSVLYFGGLGDFSYQHEITPAFQQVLVDAAGPLVSSGRAFIYPVLYGSFDRYDGYFEIEPLEDIHAAQIKRATRWRQDIGHVIDYLEERADFDGNAVAFMGMSYGGIFGVNTLTVEPRIKAAIIMGGGIWLVRDVTPHEMFDPLNYFPRIQQPVLMLTGEYDYVVPVDSVQIPSFDKLTAEHKRHVIIEGAGHWPFPRAVFLKEVGDWLDIYLGKVQQLRREAI
ncbi:MAG: SUMF1/EgtB/PvdO family nonheme iron enzyme [Gemmatimonadales bacterium]